MTPKRIVKSKKDVVCFARNTLLRRITKAAIKAMLKKMIELATE